MEVIYLVEVISTDNFAWDNVDVQTFPCETKERAMQIFKQNSDAIAEDFQGDEEFTHIKRSNMKHTFIDTFSGKFSEVKIGVKILL